MNPLVLEDNTSTQAQSRLAESPRVTKKKVAFVQSFANHYTSRTFELLAAQFDAHFYFFSRGREWYWMKQHGVETGNFPHEYLPGFQLGRIRIVPTLPLKLLLSDFDVCVKCLNGRFALPVTYLVTRLRRRPFVLWTEVWQRLQTPFHRFAFPLTRYIYRHADAIVVCGTHVKRYLISEGVPAERIFIGNYAVDNESFSSLVPDEDKNMLRRQLGVEPETKIVLYLGRLTVDKGLAYLIEAFASLARNDAVLVLAGDGDAKAELEKLVEHRGIRGRVRFPGYVSQKDTLRYYAVSWVYVLPSITTARFKEPWGVVVNEAFNQGVPVIATDAVGAAAGGLVEDEVNGFIVPERNNEALAGALARLLDDSELRRRMSRNASEKILLYTQERWADGFCQAITYVTQTR